MGQQAVYQGPRPGWEFDQPAPTSNLSQSRLPPRHLRSSGATADRRKTAEPEFWWRKIEAAALATELRAPRYIPDLLSNPRPWPAFIQSRPDTPTDDITGQLGLSFIACYNLFVRPELNKRAKNTDWTSKMNEVWSRSWKDQHEQHSWVSVRQK